MISLGLPPEASDTPLEQPTDDDTFDQATVISSGFDGVTVVSSAYDQTTLVNQPTLWIPRLGRGVPIPPAPPPEPADRSSGSSARNESDHLSAEEVRAIVEESEPFMLAPNEEYWRDKYNWLLEQGYRLRPRYHPDWEPSWRKDKKVHAGLTEDSQAIPNGNLIDAIRVEDGKYVVLKLVDTQAAEIDEALILQYFSDEPHHSDPRNHCVELLDALNLPDDDNHTIVVLPVLRPYDSPEFDTIGEGLDFLRQVMQGLCFLHEHRVAHRDIRSENFMMDGRKMYSEQYRAFDPDKKLDYSGSVSPRRTRTACWPKYYIIDFGFSKQYREQDMPPSELPKHTTDATVPEFDNPGVPCNPFPIDVYTFGNLIRMDFIEGNPLNIQQNGRQGFEFLRPLVIAMTDKDPAKRPTMEEALDQLDEIISALGFWKLRSRPVRVPGGLISPPSTLDRIQTTATHWSRKLKYVVTFKQPLPAKPKPTKQRTSGDKVGEGEIEGQVGDGDDDEGDIEDLVDKASISGKMDKLSIGGLDVEGETSDVGRVDAGQSGADAGSTSAVTTDPKKA